LFCFVLCSFQGFVCVREMLKLSHVSKVMLSSVLSGNKSTALPDFPTDTFDVLAVDDSAVNLKVLQVIFFCFVLFLSFNCTQPREC
jgi:hypothetical protein